MNPNHTNGGESILEQIKKADYPFGLANDYEGSCPCAEFKLSDKDGKVYAQSRCWRVSDNAQDLYIWGEHPHKRKIANALKKALDATEWYNPYTIIMEEQE